MRITKNEINRLKPGQRRFIWDDDIKGFGARVTEGAVSYVVDFQVGSKRRRVSLGSVHLQTLDKAREQASAILLAARCGIDKTVIATDGRATFREMWDNLRSEVDAKDRAPATLASYDQRIRPVLAKLGDKAVEDISVADVEALVASLNGDRNRSYAIALIKKTINWAKKKRALPDSHRNPASDVKTKRPIKRNKALSAETLEKFGVALAELEREGKVSPWVANFFRLALICGLRPGEVRTLKWDAIKFGDREMTVTGKTGSRPIWLSDEALQILQSTPIVEGCSFVFAGRRFGEPLQAVHKMLKIVQERAGIDRFPPYAFRHTAATSSLRGGVDLATVQALLGHASITTTAGYLHTDDARRKNAARQAGLAGRVVVPMHGRKQRVP